VKKRIFIPMVAIIAFSTLFIIHGAPTAAQSQPSETGEAVLGKLIFFDEDLSATRTQSCATCHGPEVGFTGPDSATNAGGAVYQGAIPGRYGNRKPPAAAYAGDSPLLHQDASGAWYGGMFWDGRATGAVLGDPLAEQAQGPFLNPLEQALPNARLLCVRVRQSEYADLFRQMWGPGSLDCANDVQGVYERIGRSVAAYEKSPEVNPFSSKFDLFWDTALAAGKDVRLIRCGMGGGGGGGGMGCPGGGSDPNRWTTYRNLGFSDAELQGLAVFNDPNKANCASCHSLAPGSAGYPLFTDFGYDNIGVPKNPANPFYHMPPQWNPDGESWVDYGLGHYLESAGYAPEVYLPQMGKVKVPTLRNVDLRPSPDFVKAYGHNGYFKSLTQIVQFYHWRAMMDGGCMGGCMGGGMGGGRRGGMGGGMQDMFPPPEVDENRAVLNMFPMPQIGNVVAFLQTLSDGYFQR
jgi:cytochrome c peroxidase